MEGGHSKTRPSSPVKDDHVDELAVVETDPSGRYSRVSGGNYAHLR